MGVCCRSNCSLLSLGAGLLGFHLVERRFMPSRQVA